MRSRIALALLMGVVLIAVSIWLGWVVVIAVVIGITSVFGMRYLLRAPKSGTWWDLTSPVRVSRGDHAELSIAVSLSPGSTRWVSAVDGGASHRVFVGSGDFGGDLSGDFGGVLTWEIDTRRRGRFDVGPTLLEVADPFGVYRRTLAQRSQTSVLVVPRVHAVPQAAVVLNTHAESGTERAGSDTFESVREYVVGDPQKLVHWKASARAGKLMVRRMVDTTMPWLLVVLDVNIKAYDRSGSLFDDFNPEAFEESVETAASWGWHGCRSQQRVLLTTTALSGTGAEAAVEVTIRNRESALDWLALVEPLSPQACGPARVKALIGRHSVSRAVVITGAQHIGASPWISQLQQRVSVMTIVGHS